ncbi:MAG: hypothetical protein HY698_13915, partial [Deltaproteobacteria bacterium]|nr:hypothetical protein [Deltaproteobacteria bacterium]
MQSVFGIVSKSKVALIGLLALVTSPVPSSVVRQPTSAIGQLRELDRQALGAEDAHYAAEYRFQDGLASRIVGDRPISDGELAVLRQNEESAKASIAVLHQRREEYVTRLVAKAQDGNVTVAALAALLVDLRVRSDEIRYEGISS